MSSFVTFFFATYRRGLQQVGKEEQHEESKETQISLRRCRRRRSRVEDAPSPDLPRSLGQEDAPERTGNLQDSSPGGTPACTACATACNNLFRIKLVNPDPPPREIWEGANDPSRSGDPKDRSEQIHRCEAPTSFTAGGDANLHQKHRRPPNLLQGASGGRAPRTYTIYSRGTQIPRPPAAGAADGGRGIRRNGGEVVDLRGR